VNELIPTLVENRFRIRRLAALAVSEGPAACAAADRVFEIVAAATHTKAFDVVGILGEIDNFNQAAQRAHSEMIASRSPR